MTPGNSGVRLEDDILRKCVVNTQCGYCASSHNVVQGLGETSTAVEAAEIEMSELPDFNLSSVGIGGTFYCAGREYRVTDKGTRVIVAVEVTDEARADPTWLEGPTYALAEIVFDEDDFPVMTLEPEA